MKISPAKSLSGEITVPGDKSISHRSVMLGAIARGETRVRGFLKSADCLSTIGCFKAMGVKIYESETGVLVINGAGPDGLKAPVIPLDCGNSGTTARMISGLLSGQPFRSCLMGDASLSKRPMKRVMEPLNSLGADIVSDNDAGTLPLTINPASIHGGRIETGVSSAQVKSALLLAGLYADSPLTVREPSLSRNHTELMLKSFGAKIDFGTFDNPECRVYPHPELNGIKITVPGDISSAAYFLGAALLVPHSNILIKNVGINETRSGILKVFEDMKANFVLENIMYAGEEKTANIDVRSSSLKAAEIGGDLIPLLIDELPLIAVAATQAEGRTVIKDAAELKVKESNRIELMVNGLKAMGADIEATDDGMIINGPTPLHGAEITTGGDHRIAMSFAIAALISKDNRHPVELDDAACVNISYPSFFKDLASLVQL